MLQGGRGGRQRTRVCIVTEWRLTLVMLCLALLQILLHFELGL